MSDGAAAARAIAELEADIALARAHRAAIARALDAARLRRDLALQLLAPWDGASLSIVPLVAAVASALAALGAALAAYATLLGASGVWTAGGLVAVTVAFSTSAAARGSGAGGRARGWLRRFGFALAALSAVLLLLGAGVSLRLAP
ncbi:MAG TPA: hypothetical protein VHB21_11180 [Minicystis sp.]|nr:hypothetical protein [Minicystis sp.]